MTEAAPGPGRPIDRSLRLRLRIYLLILVVTVALVVGDAVAIGGRSVVPVLVGAAVGTALGLVASRIYALSWDEASGTVIGRLDAIGIVILLGYVAFVVLRSRILDLWFAAPVVGVAGLATLAGLMAGQVVGTGRGVQRIVGVVRGQA